MILAYIFINEKNIFLTMLNNVNVTQIIKITSKIPALRQD